MDRKTFLMTTSALAAAGSVPEAARAANAVSTMSAHAALKNLMDGNARFAAGKPTCRPLIERVRELASGQSPFATVLGCADSRVPVETIFDREPGDIFVVRLAGNFMSEAALASIEYAVAVLKSPLVLVLGHTACGAVKAAVDFVQTGKPLPGHMQTLAAAIEPAAKATQHAHGDWWHNAVIENVRLNVESLRSSTPILHEAVSRGEAHVTGGIYDLSNGKVTLV
jgi:carbonic anhydrase